jgi:hypothetical protein
MIKFVQAVIYTLESVVSLSLSLSLKFGGGVIYTLKNIGI